MYILSLSGKFGHEFLEFEFRPDGKLRYANNSNYKNDTMIRKECNVNVNVLKVRVSFFCSCELPKSSLKLKNLPANPLLND